MHGMESFRIKWNRANGAVAVEYPYQQVCTSSRSEQQNIPTFKRKALYE